MTPFAGVGGGIGEPCPLPGPGEPQGWSLCNMQLFYYCTGLSGLHTKLVRVICGQQPKSVKWIKLLFFYQIKLSYIQSFLHFQYNWIESITLKIIVMFIHLDADIQRLLSVVYTSI